MPLPIPFYLRNNQTSPLSHAQLDGNLSILSAKIDNTTCGNVGTGIGIFKDKEVGNNDGTMNLYSLSGTNGIEVGISGNSIIIDGSAITGGTGGGAMSFTVGGDNGTPFTIVSGDTLQFTGLTGLNIGVSDPEVRIAMDYTGPDSFIMAAADGTGITVDGTNDKLVIFDADAGSSGVVKYINADQIGGSGFDWCDAHVMSGNTSGCCLDNLWVTTLSGCSPIHIGGSDRTKGINGNVNVDGVLNIKNQSNFNTAPYNNEKTAHLLVWNSNSTLGDLTIGDVEYVHKKQLFKRVIKPFTPWEPAGPIEVGNDPAGPGIGIVIGPNNGIELIATTADTEIHLGETGGTISWNHEITPIKDELVKVDSSTVTELITRMDTTDGFLVKSEVAGVVKRTVMSADKIETTGTIKASVISATTVMVGGASLSACCETDSYYSGGTPAGNWTWDLSGQSTNFEITLVAPTSQLDLTNVRNGEYGTIIVHQDASGGRALTLGTINGAVGKHYVVNGGNGFVTLSATASDIDILSFTYNGEYTFWTVGNDYT